MKGVFAAIISAALLSGCATTPEPYESDPGDSRALSVMKAAGFTALEDVPAPSGDAVLSDLGGAYSGLAYGISGAALDALRFKSLGAGLLDFGTIFSGPDEDDLARMSWLIAWVPASEASDAARAKAHLHDLVQAALHDVIREAEIATHVAAVKEFPAEGNAYQGAQYIQQPGRRYVLSAPVCEQSSVQCEIHVTTSGSRLNNAFAPDFLGGGSAYFGLAQIRPSVVRDEFLARYNEAAFNELDLYLRLSEKLPEWVYLYFGPKRLSAPDGKGDFMLLPYPLVMNQGKVFLFVKPS